MRSDVKRWLKVVRPQLAAVMAACFAATLMACQDKTLGLCYHDYREPLLKIVAAVDAQTGASIPEIVVSNVRRDGTIEILHFLVANPSYGVELQGDSIVCEVPCGFGTHEGNYIFTVSATGYPPQDRGYEGRYRVFKGGCPSYNDGGVEITIVMHRGD